MNINFVHHFFYLLKEPRKLMISIYYVKDDKEVCYMNKVEIIRPRERDINELNKFFYNVIKDTYDKEGVGHLVEDINDEINSKNEYIKMDLESCGKERFFLLAKYDGKIVGCIALGPVSELIIECSDAKLKDHIEIGSVLVDPDHHNKGIGSLLLKSTFIALMARGETKFCLDSGYREAKKVWTKIFGEPDYIKKDQWGEGKDHYVWGVSVSDINVSFSIKD